MYMQVHKGKKTTQINGLQKKKKGVIIITFFFSLPWSFEFVNLILRKRISGFALAHFWTPSLSFPRWFDLKTGSLGRDKEERSSKLAIRFP